MSRLSVSPVGFRIGLFAALRLRGEAERYRQRERKTPRSAGTLVGAEHVRNTCRLYGVGNFDALPRAVGVAASIYRY